LKSCGKAGLHNPPLSANRGNRGNRIPAAAGERIAAEQAESCHRPTLQQPMLRQGKRGVLRTRGLVGAATRARRQRVNHGRKQALVHGKRRIDGSVLSGLRTRHGSTLLTGVVFLLPLPLFCMRRGVRGKGVFTVPLAIRRATVENTACISLASA